MSHRMLSTAVLSCLVCTLAVASPAPAQHQDPDRFALALGAGVVEPDDEGELFFMSALRIRLGKDERAQDGEDWRYERRGEIEAYLEPEIGYWERDEAGVTESDLNIGVNAIGVVPGRTVDYFFGVGLGLHALDTEVRSAGRSTFEESDTHFGGNFQVGLDIHLSRSVSLFGAGRFDVIEGLDETLQGKVYMGLRFGF